MSSRSLIACMLVAAGCYRPGPENNCTVQCTAARGCADGFSCESGMCRDPSSSPCGGPQDAALPDAARRDAAPDPDAYMDAPIDASTAVDAPFIDAAPNPNCWGRDLITYCPNQPPNTDFTFSAGVVIDTNGSMCATDRNDVCVIARVRITVTGRITATGSRPLVLIATNDLTIATLGEIDVSSTPGNAGAGAGVGTCAAGTAGQSLGMINSGGGAGGTLSGRGGFGGSSGTVGAMGGTPGAPPSSAVTAPRGGCPGTQGGGLSGGAGGPGGGGVVLVAGGSILMQGKVLARGSGGLGGGGSRGGGGGGSGGLIALDGTMIMLAGSLVAAGGGGGGGGDPAQPGSIGDTASSTGTPASGGAAGGSGEGHGGQGSGPASLRNGLPGFSVTAGAGGGGGGAAGIIRIYGMVIPTGTPTIVPPAS